MLIGNRCDLEDKREVSYQEGKNFAKSKGMHFMEASGKTGYNVNNIFQVMVEKIFESEKCRIFPADFGLQTSKNFPELMKYIDY